MPRRIRKRITILVLLLLVGWAIVLVGGRKVNERLAPPGPQGAPPVMVTIPAGASTRDVAQILVQHGLIRDASVFGYYARYRKMDNLLQGGEYELSAAMTPEQILLKLSKGEVLVHRFTVPEGLTVAQMADLLASKNLVEKQKFLQAAASSTAVAQYLPKGVKLAQPLEGYLFPSTYEYRPGATEPQIVALMTAEFARIWTPDRQKRADELGMTVHQVLTLASIIEKETQVPSERAIVSGVYHNRLGIGMKMDADPTVRYALDKPPSLPLLYKDLEVDSPYNTYRVAGLPPGPIASPGEAAIQAALYPAKHDYWYFVAKENGTGEHYFSHTLEEQTQNIARAEQNLKK